MWYKKEAKDANDEKMIIAIFCMQKLSQNLC